MNKVLHYYLVVNVNDMYNINYTMLDENINNEKKGLISYTGCNCQEIFEENKIPFDMQKIYISINVLKNILCKEEIGKEYFTGIPIKIFKKRYDNYSTSGEMAGKYPGFRFTNAKECDDNELVKFLISLRKNNLVDCYLKCLGEIFKIDIKTNENTPSKNNNLHI